MNAQVEPKQQQASIKTFVINKAAEVLSIYDDKIVPCLQRLNNQQGLQVTRFCTVEYNATTQEWEAVNPKTNKVVLHHPKREKVLEMERALLEHTLAFT